MASGGHSRDGTAVNAVTVAPHFRKQGDIRPHLMGLPASGQALLQVFFQGEAGRDLQQGDFEHGHGAYLLFTGKYTASGCRRKALPCTAGRAVVS